MSGPASTRVYLDIPFSQRAQARAMGLSWDTTRRQWWIPQEPAQRLIKDRSFRQQLAQWIPVRATSIPKSVRRRREGYVCAACGDPVPGPSQTLCRRHTN